MSLIKPLLLVTNSAFKLYEAQRIIGKHNAIIDAISRQKCLTVLAPTTQQQPQDIHRLSTLHSLR